MQRRARWKHMRLAHNHSHNVEILNIFIDYLPRKSEDQFNIKIKHTTQRDSYIPLKTHVRCSQLLTVHTNVEHFNTKRTQVIQV